MNSSMRVFFQLMRRDTLTFRREYPEKFFDTCIVFFTNILVFAYFMPNEGLSKTYGPFVLVGAIASFGLIEIVGKISLLLSDIEGERTISHTLIMPIKAAWVFCYIALFWALTSALLAAPLFPLGKLLLWNRFDLTKISYLRFLLIFISSNLFFGFFALWLSSILRGIKSLNSLWLRIIVPMWMFGSYLYSWQAAYHLNPIIGYVSLANPMIYVMEGSRAAVLGQEGFIPFWISLLTLWAFTAACGVHSIFRLKKRLDCV